ncbi:DUF7544 domain-containing protein [Haloarchaeobius iranensis]|uniref:Uncharacterized protein n=1 Tax=Haloarchaeobius iranensis TaxID=996166 RepID=A0A1G9UFB9_9EURY|nr:hypothetical protein [Haloarchaeobius iranensis]SDM58598.1 hypothetical protein SAMN05192554_10497 [Haloarchaeobius iranensis]
MSLHAVDELDDAIDVTKGLLLPFDLRHWLKLALVVLFVSGGARFPSYAFNFAQPSGTVDAGGIVEEGLLLPAVIALVALVVGFFLLFGVVGAAMEFVFVEALVSGEVRIRRHFREYWRRGLRLFGFRLAVTLPMLLVVVGLVAAFLFPVLAGNGVELGLILLLAAIPLLFVLAFVVGIVNGFTSVFVVPVMLADDCGVLDGWRTLWPSITDETVEYIGFAVINYVIRLVSGTAAAMVLGVTALVLLLPAALVVFAVAEVLSATSGLLVAATFVVVGTVYVAALFAVWAVVLVPVESYHRYHALLVLGDILPGYDLVADRRPSDAGGSGGATPGDGGGPGGFDDGDGFEGDRPTDGADDGSPGPV